MPIRSGRLGVNPSMGNGAPDVSAIGNRVGELDPRGIYGENQSVPTNILGERAQIVDLKVTAGGAGQFPANQLPVPSTVQLPEDRRYVERGPFGHLAPGQVPDSNLILGENTMGHHIGAPPPAGQGAMDHEAERALGLGIYGIAPMHPLEKTLRERFDQMLFAYEQFANNIESNLLELRSLDPARFDSQYAHLFKVNLPRPVPDPTLQVGFTTLEAAIQAKQSRSPPMSGFRTLTEEEAAELRQQARKPAEIKFVSPYSRAALDRAAGRTAQPGSAPKPWKESR